MSWFSLFCLSGWQRGGTERQNTTWRHHVKRTKAASILSVAVSLNRVPNIKLWSTTLAQIRSSCPCEGSTYNTWDQDKGIWILSLLFIFILYYDHHRRWPPSEDTSASAEDADWLSSRGVSVGGVDVCGYYYVSVPRIKKARKDESSCQFPLRSADTINSSIVLISGITHVCAILTDIQGQVPRVFLTFLLV